MNEPTPEQRLMLERTREFAQRHVAPQATQWARERSSCVGLFADAAKLGLLGLQVPPSQGGQGLPFSCKLQAAELLAAADFGVAMALVNTPNVAEQVARLGQPGLVQRLVDPGEPCEAALSRVLREFLAAGPQAAPARCCG